MNWIKTSDLLPEEDDKVLICHAQERISGSMNPDYVFLVGYGSHKEKWPFFSLDGVDFYRAKYWMPLPQTPSE